MAASNAKAETIKKTRGTKGTRANHATGKASSGSPDPKTEGTTGNLCIEEAAIDPVEDSTGAELNADLDFPGMDHRPRWKCYWDWCGPLTDSGNRIKPAGVYYHGLTEGTEKKPAVAYDMLVCSPLEVKAVTRTDDHSETYGLLLKFRDLDGKQREWAMPRNLLRGSCEEMRGELLDHGVSISEKHKLAEWLQRPAPKERVIAATATGWADAGRSFVLPHRVIGPSNVIFQSERASTEGSAATGGTFAAWQKEIAALCVGNPVPMLSICVALAGPLLAKVHRQSCGIHWVNDSSTGKTTALMVGASVWGGDKFTRTWRSTANGLEGAASSLNDTCLCLDEISEADPKQIGEIVYSIANGVGKTRANRIGAARRVLRWQLTVLSTGERTVRAQMAEAGKLVKAGQEIRLLNVPASRTHGAFDELHQFPDGRALSDHLKTVCKQHHGHAGPAFVEHILSDGRDFGGELQYLIELGQFKAPDSQSGRAASSFALFGLAGELATEYGIVPWPKGAALVSAAEGYQSWLETRGKGITEHRQILQAIADYIARHGDSRFSEKGKIEEKPVINRAGWWTEEGDSERIYLFNSPALREAGNGYDIKRILSALSSADWIAAHDHGKHSKKTHIGPGQKPALYWVKVGEVEE
jgi:putative DNA primase/helicase